MRQQKYLIFYLVTDAYTNITKPLYYRILPWQSTIAITKFRKAKRDEASLQWTFEKFDDLRVSVDVKSYISDQWNSEQKQPFEDVL